MYYQYSYVQQQALDGFFSYSHNIVLYLILMLPGIAVGKEESDFKEFDNFTLFTERLKSTGVDAVLAGPGPFTVFAVTDNAIKSYEKTVGPVTADVLKYCIVKGEVPSASVGSADLSNELGKSLTYSRKFRKDFVDDAILGEKTFGPFSDFPVDVKCDNGIIHSIGLCLDPAYSAVGGGVGATQL